MGRQEGSRLGTAWDQSPVQPCLCPLAVVDLGLRPAKGKALGHMRVPCPGIGLQG